MFNNKGCCNDSPCLNSVCVMGNMIELMRESNIAFENYCDDANLTKEERLFLEKHLEGIANTIIKDSDRNPHHCKLHKECTHVKRGYLNCEQRKCTHLNTLVGYWYKMTSHE